MLQELQNGTIKEAELRIIVSNGHLQIGNAALDHHGIMSPPDGRVHDACHDTEDGFWGAPSSDSPREGNRFQSMQGGCPESDSKSCWKFFGYIFTVIFNVLCCWTFSCLIHNCFIFSVQLLHHVELFQVLIFMGPVSLIVSNVHLAFYQ